MKNKKAELTLTPRQAHVLRNHLAQADYWMRELHGWLWKHIPESVLRAALIDDIKEGEKVHKSIFGGSVKKVHIVW